MVKSGGVLSTRLTLRLACTRSSSLSAVLRGKGQAQAILAVIQALVPDDAIAAVIGQGQGEDGHALHWRSGSDRLSGRRAPSRGWSGRAARGAL